MGPQTLVNTGLRGFQKIQNQGLRIGFWCVILSAMKEVPVRHPARKCGPGSYCTSFFIPVFRPNKRKDKNNANCNYETEFYEISQNARKYGVCISMFLFPDNPPGFWSRWHNRWAVTMLIWFCLGTNNFWLISGSPEREEFRAILFILREPWQLRFHHAHVAQLVERPAVLAG